MTGKLTVTELDSIFPVRNETGWRYGINNRGVTALVFVKSGRYRYRQGGADIFSDRGAFVILPEGATYEMACLEGGECCLVQFYTMERMKQILCLPVPGEQLAELDRIGEKLLSDAQKIRIRRFAMMSELYRALSILWHPETEDAHHPLLEAPLNAMRRQFADRTLNNDTLAAMAKISTVYFRRLFTEAFGTSPMRYLKHIRLDHAKQLLRYGGASVEEIAEKCGFSGMYYFSAAFKEATGLSPSQYAKRYHLM